MRAAYVTERGPADTIVVGDRPDPTPADGEVLVAVDTVSVNPVDTYVRSGRYATPIPLPFVVGRDLVGTVAALGGGVEAFRVGDRVWCNSAGHEGRQGPSAEYAVVPVDRLYPLPDGVDPDTAVAVAHPAATAYLGWFVRARLLAGETVLVAGGAGNVGTAAVQMAAYAGARVVATARPSDHEACRAAGADAVLDYADPDLGDRIAEVAPDGVDVLWDTAGHHDFALAGRILAPEARVLVTAATVREPVVPLFPLYTRDVSVLGFVISLAPAHELAAAARLVNRMLADGLLTTRVTERMGLADMAEAHRRMESGTVRGRLLVDVRR